MKFRIVAVLGVLAAGPSLASAGTSSLGTLQDLIDAGATGITVGDKQFYNFSYQGTGVTADQITVVQAPGSDIGVEFQFNWMSTNNNSEDSDIRFNVHVIDPAQNITGVGLHFDGNVVNGGNLLTNANVTETVTDLDGNQLGKLSVFNAGPDFSNLNQNDAFLSLSPTRDLALTKDILVHSASALQPALSDAVAINPTATISLVDNTFRQTGTPSVPLPPALWAVLGTVALGALPPVRRKLRAAVTA